MITPTELEQARQDLRGAAKEEAVAIQEWAIAMTHLEDSQAEAARARARCDAARNEVARLSARVASLQRESALSGPHQPRQGS